ncbi:MAG: ral secretion pathway protein GspC [Bacteriovoracaceae bacterium]|nr:ral secretion pathway protein GspC [Bacteriovoracaceae bacterium]
MRLLNYLGNILQSLTRHQNTIWRLGFIVVITFFLAKSANLMIAHFYLPLEFGSKPMSLSQEAPKSQAQVSIQSILSRNIFDSEVRNRSSSGREVVGGPISPSSMPLELLGTIVFRNSKYSVALIQERSSKKTQYYGIGDSILAARIHKIERFRVILENGSHLESLELKAAENKISGSNLFQTEAPPVDTNIPFEEVGPNKYIIPQGVVDDALGNFSKILTQARMVPNLTPDNKTDGFKVFQIRSGSIYEKLGMKDNDIIKRVNGQDLDSFEKATGLFTALRSEKTISIDLVRNGTRINYSYEIR